MANNSKWICFCWHYCKNYWLTNCKKSIYYSIINAKCCMQKARHVMHWFCLSYDYWLLNINKWDGRKMYVKNCASLNVKTSCSKTLPAMSALVYNASCSWVRIRPENNDNTYKACAARSTNCGIMHQNGRQRWLHTIDTIDYCYCRGRSNSQLDIKYTADYWLGRKQFPMTAPTKYIKFTAPQQMKYTRWIIKPLLVIGQSHNHVPLPLLR